MTDATPTTDPTTTAADEAPPKRVLQPVGALFEAAFRRFGVRLGPYLLYGIAFALIPAFAIGIDRFISGTTRTELWLLAAFYSLGQFLLVGTLTADVAGAGRALRLQSAGAAVIAAVIAACLYLLEPPLVVVAYPLLVLAPIAAAAGDANALSAIVTASGVFARHFIRVYQALLGLALIAAGLWIGFMLLTVGFIGLGNAQVAAFALSTIVLWPIAALVERNLYGDVTGRLVMRAAPDENDRRKALRRDEKARKAAARARHKG